MTRSQSREIAFTLLFEKTFTEDSISEIIDKAAEGSALEVDAFARSLAQGTVGHLEEIDDLLATSSKNWKLSRISRVALSALRVAAYEMLYEKEIPESVSINEAIELTKKFASPEDASFVNGVLGAISRASTGENIQDTKESPVED